MRGFELYGTVKAVISICDSMNYIMEYQELVQVFRLVNNYLDPKGVFILTSTQNISTGNCWRTIHLQKTGRNPALSGIIFYDEEDKVNEYDLTLL